MQQRTRAGMAVVFAALDGTRHLVRFILHRLHPNCTTNRRALKGHGAANVLPEKNFRRTSAFSGTQ